MILERSIVVISPNVNPSILNHDWLIRKSVVNEEWGWAPINSINIPPFSNIEYDAGIVINFELNNKISVTFRNDNIEDLEISDFFHNLINAVNLNSFKAEGNNLKAFFETEINFILNRFITDNLDFGDEENINSDIKFIYKNEFVKKIINFSTGSLQNVTGEDPNQTLEGILVDVNYHHECSTKEDIDRVVASYQEEYDDALGKIERLTDIRD